MREEEPLDSEIRMKLDRKFKELWSSTVFGQYGEPADGFISLGGRQYCASESAEYLKMYIKKVVYSNDFSPEYAEYVLELTEGARSCLRYFEDYCEKMHRFYSELKKNKNG